MRAVVTVNQLDLIFSALSDRTRRGILAHLAQGEASVTELVEPFKLSQPSISKHLKALERAGLVTRRRAGKSRPCRINHVPLQAAAVWLGDYRRFWEESLDNLAEYVKEVHGKQAVRLNRTRRPRSSSRAL